MLNDSVFAYGAGQCLIVSVDLPVTGHITEASREQPFLAFGMTLKPAAIAALLLESDRGDQERRSPLGIASNDATPELLDAIVRLLRLLDSPGRPARAGPRGRARDPLAADHRQPRARWSARSGSPTAACR